MTSTAQDWREHVIETSKARGEFIHDVDGFLYFLPASGKGHLAAHHLRAIADHLDAENEEWNKQIERDLS